MTTAAQQIITSARMDGQTKIPEYYWELVGQYREELIRQSFTILKSREDAEDVAQETFWEAYRADQKLSDTRSIRAWLRSINRNKALNRLRDNKRSKRKAVDKQRELDEKTFTTGGFSALELNESVKKVLETLPHELRTIVELRFWKQLSYREIAELLKIRIDTVHIRLAEALEYMYAKLEGQLESGLSSGVSVVAGNADLASGGHPPTISDTES